MQSGMPGAPAGWTRKIPASSPYPAPDRLPQGKPVRHGAPSTRTSPLHYPYGLPSDMIPRIYPLQVLPFGLSPYRLRRSPATAHAVRLRHLHPGDILAAGGVGRTTLQGCGETRHENPAAWARQGRPGRSPALATEPLGLPTTSSPSESPKSPTPTPRKDKCKPLCFMLSAFHNITFYIITFHNITHHNITLHNITCYFPTRKPSTSKLLCIPQLYLLQLCVLLPTCKHLYSQHFYGFHNDTL